MNFFDVIKAFDIGTVRFVHEHLSGVLLDFLMPVVTLLGEDGIFWICTSLLLLCFKRTRKAGFVMALSMLLGFLVGNLTLKPLVARIRPYDIDTQVKLLIKPLSDYSFPSGHTLVCFEGAVSLLACGYKKWGTAALAAAIIVAFSRVYLYVHYPTDVLAGAVLGSLFAFVSCYIVNRIYKLAQKSETL